MNNLLLIMKIISLSCTLETSLMYFNNYRRIFNGQIHRKITLSGIDDFIDEWIRQ